MAGQVGSDRWQSGSIETAGEQRVRPEEIKPVWSEVMENKNGDDSQRDGEEEMVPHDGGVGAGDPVMMEDLFGPGSAAGYVRLDQDVRLSEDEQCDGLGHEVVAGEEGRVPKCQHQPG